MSESGKIIWQWIIFGFVQYFRFLLIFAAIGLGLFLYDRKCGIPREFPRGQALREALLSSRNLALWAGLSAAIWALAYLCHFPQPVNFSDSWYLKLVGSAHASESSTVHAAKTSWLYYPLWTGFVLLTADAAFYWGHRFLHWGPAYRRIHSVHHKFVTPTAWSAYSNHYGEAALTAVTGFFIPYMLVPLSPTPAVLLGIFAVFWAGFIHTGMVKKPWSSTLSKYIYSPAHHRIHHGTGDHNFGLYFTFWDRVFETESTGD